MNTNWQSRRLSNKVWKLARPLLGIPDYLESLRQIRNVNPAFNRIPQTDEAPNTAAHLTTPYITNVGPLSFRHFIYPDSDLNDTVQDTLRDIGNTHYNLLNEGTTVNLPYDLSNNTRDKIINSVGFDLPRRIFENLHPAFQSYIRQHRQPIDLFTDYSKFLKDYFNHINSIPNTETKPDLLTYLGGYKHKPLKIAASLMFNHTYPSTSSAAFRDWHQENINPQNIEQMKKIDRYNYPGTSPDPYDVKKANIPDFARVIQSVIPHMVYDNLKPRSPHLTDITNFVKGHFDE